MEGEGEGRSPSQLAGRGCIMGRRGVGRGRGRRNAIPAGGHSSNGGWAGAGSAVGQDGELWGPAACWKGRGLPVEVRRRVRRDSKGHTKERTSVYRGHSPLRALATSQQLRGTAWAAPGGGKWGRSWCYSSRGAPSTQSRREPGSAVTACSPIPILETKTEAQSWGSTCPKPFPVSQAVSASSCTREEAAAQGRRAK